MFRAFVLLALKHHNRYLKPFPRIPGRLALLFVLEVCQAALHRRPPGGEVDLMDFDILATVVGRAVAFEVLVWDMYTGFREQKRELSF